MLDDPGSIILYIVLLICSAFFSGIEMSLASINRIHMMSCADKGDVKAKHVLRILDNFEEALSVILIGNNVVNIGCATITVIIANQIGADIGIATLVTTVIIFVFGEMLPKCFARSCNESFARNSCGILLILMKLLKPLSALFTALSRGVSAPFSKRLEPEVTMTEDELYDIVENISEEDGFDEETGKLVKSAMDFGDRTVREILVPWGDVLKISTSMKTPEILETIKKTVHSRIPVVARDGTVKGILQIRRYMRAYIKSNHVVLASVMDYPYFVKADMMIDDLLTQMSNHRRNLAVVKDADGKILGIVTIEDILEELVGEIYDEDDIGGDTDA